MRLTFFGAASGVALTLLAVQPHMPRNGMFQFWSIARAANDASSRAATGETYKQLNLFGDVFERVRADYVEKPDDAKLIESAINGMLYVRGQHEDFDDWAALGATGWAARDVLPWFRRLEADAEHGVDPWHGAGGPLPLTRYPGIDPMPIHAAGIEAAMLAHFRSQHAEVLSEIRDTKAFENGTRDKVKGVLDAFTKTFA